jgi:hypothetical protein
MSPSEILGLTFKQFTLYMDNINRISKMENGGGDGEQQSSTTSPSALRNAMISRGARMPKRK